MPRNEFGKVEFCTKSISNVTFGLSDFCLHQLWCNLFLQNYYSKQNRKIFGSENYRLKIFA